MSKYPIFLELGGRRAIVIGAGAVAVRKIQSLLAAGARVVVVAKGVDKGLTELFQAGKIELIKSKYSKDYLAGAVLAIAATNDPQLNKQIYKDCQQLELLCNVVDQPELCDFFVPAVVKRGDLQIAIGTEGHCPAYSGHLRKKLEKIFGDKHGEFLSGLEAFRGKLTKDIPDAGRRKTILGQLVDDESFEYFIRNGLAQWQEYAEQITSAVLTENTE